MLTPTRLRSEHATGSMVREMTAADEQVRMVPLIHHSAVTDDVVLDRSSASLLPYVNLPICRTPCESANLSHLPHPSFFRPLRVSKPATTVTRRSEHIPRVGRFLCGSNLSLCSTRMALNPSTMGLYPRCAQIIAVAWPKRSGISWNACDCK